ncbi:hypothetical protein C8Q80DRAFT_606233 [Daedaleopsis nitida]|nr:hypothetical protein C8Q80DRAFT_606233 [Daedaleopsis nitida]
MLDNAARWYAFATDDMGYDIDERDMLLVTGVTRIETQDVEALLRAQPPSAPVERRRWSVSAHALAQEVGLGLLGGIEYTYGLPVGSLAPALSSLWHIVVTPQNSSDVGFGFVPYFMSNNKRGHFKKTFIHYYKMRRVSLWRDWVYDPVVSAIADLAPSDSERVRPAYNPVDDLLRYIARRSPLADAVIASDVDVYKLFEHLECSPTRTPHEMRDALERLSPEVGYIELGAFKRVAALKIVCDELGKAEEFGVENLRTSHQPKS